MPESMRPERRDRLWWEIQLYLQHHYAEDLAGKNTRYSLKSAQPARQDWSKQARYFDHRCEEALSVRQLVDQAEQEETFSQMLLRMIRDKQLTEPEVYNRVFMDRKLFNKIRNTPEYQPSKRTALLLAVALKLDLEQTGELLGKAGFRLVPWNKFDVIVEYFIANGNYDILEINEMLALFQMPLLLNCQ